jgi:HPt (histidine-containing phosphotransfer) domain-containing protein
MPLDRRPIEQMIADVGAAAFRRLAGLFLAETRGAVVEMRRLCAAQDWRALGRQAHSLKNATASFGLADLSATALALESAADAGRAADAEAALTRLRSTLEAELTALEGAVAALG